MKNMILAMVLIGVGASSAGAQLYREGVFGLDTPAHRWTWRTDMIYFGAPYEGRFGQASDAANIRFASDQDTTDIILIVNCQQSVIHWLRAAAGPNPRTLQRLGTYGELGSGPGQFIDIYPLAVASTTDLYDPSTDHIFVGDRMNHSVVKLNFEFHPTSPESDTIIWESSAFVDSNFYAVDLEYIDYGTGNIDDNRLLALDDIGNRMAVFTHQGDLIQLHDLQDPADSVYHIYGASAHKVNSNGSATLYLADRSETSLRRYIYTSVGRLDYVNEINLGDRMQTTLCDVIYSDRFGLWAVESRGPHLYKLAENLSHVLFEISGEEFDPPSLFHIQKIAVLPERIVVFEQMGAETGLLTFAFDPPSGKRQNGAGDVIPHIFELSQNYPNPFNPNTIIKFEIPQAGWVRLDIFNILGQRVTRLVDEYRNAGSHSVVWEGTDSYGRKVSTGVYFSKLTSGDNTEVKKMLLLK